MQKSGILIGYSQGLRVCNLTISGVYMLKFVGSFGSSLFFAWLVYDICHFEDFGFAGAMHAFNFAFWSWIVVFEMHREKIVQKIDLIEIQARTRNYTH